MLDKTDRLTDRQTDKRTYLQISSKFWQVTNRQTNILAKNCKFWQVIKPLSRLIYPNNHRYTFTPVKKKKKKKNENRFFLSISIVKDSLCRVAAVCVVKGRCSFNELKTKSLFNQNYV